MNTLIDHIDENIQSFQTDTGVPFDQSIGADQHGSAGHFTGQGIAITAGMSADEVFLELAAVFLGNGNTAKGTEPGCHPVNNSFIIYDIIDKGTGSLDAVNSVRIDLDLGVVAADSHQFFEGKVISGQDYFFNVLYIFQQHCSSSSLQDKHMVYGMYGSSITKERISKGIGCLFAGKGQPAR